MIKFLLLLLVSFSVYAEDYREPVVLPACDPNNPEVAIIETSAQFSQVNDLDKSIFCVKPANYSADFKITTSGTVDKPRYLIYFNENDTGLHPVHMAESDRVVVTKVRFEGTRHWISDRITVRNESPVPIVRMQRKLENPNHPFNNNHILINKYLVEGGGNGAGAVSMGGYNLVVQDSVIRSTTVTPHEDDHCLVMHGKNNKVVYNEIYDCAGDSVLLSPAYSYNGILAYNNLYVTSASYSDGEGNRDPNGEFLCAENAIDIQAAGNSTNPVLVKGNKMWGFDRPNDRACVSSGGGFIAFIVHFRTRYVTVEDNIILDSDIGIIAANPTVRDVDFIGNIFSKVGIAFAMPPAKSFGNSYVDNKLHEVGQLFQSPINPNDVVSGNVELEGQVCFTKFQITNPTEVCVP